MRKLNSAPAIILGVIYVVVSIFFIGKSIESSNQFKNDKNEIIEILNFNDRLLSFRDWVFSETAWQEKKEKFDVVIANSEEHYQQALNNGYYLIICSVLFFVICVLLYFKSRKFYALTFSLSLIGMMFLIEGVTNPIMEISAYKDDLTIKVYVKPSDIPYFEDAMEYMEELSELTKDVASYIEYIPYFGDGLAESANDLIDEGKTYLEMDSDNQVGFDKVFPGQTYFYYQNKGIMDVISLLWSTGNKTVAIAIGTFSVLLPAIKLFFTLFLLLSSITGWKRFRKVLSYLSKWSMADVFVVGAFLAFLSFANMSPGVQMDAKVLLGLYHFGGYVLISIVLGALLDKAMDEKQKKEIDNLPPSSQD